jgi:hypothetical protein
MIDLDDSIMITEYDNYLDLTFNDGEVVRLCRCSNEQFPELFAIQLGGTSDQITLGEPVELHVFFSMLGNDGGGIYLIHTTVFDDFLTHLKTGSEQVFSAAGARSAR